MNNLKRILSLALASVMVLGMMVVSASATEFDDDKDIVNQSAVETMNALKIIEGMPDGTFHPTDKVTRVQMAVMISKVLNGGNKPNFGVAGNSTFTDVPSTYWGAEYIEYCASLGIIAGRGDGTFDPDANVTGQEAAKMMLVIMGYNTKDFGIEGSEWATKANGYASNLGMYDGVTSLPTGELTRDNAAQLIYNGIQADTVYQDETEYGSTGISYKYKTDGPSLLEQCFDAVTVEGQLEAVEYVAEDEVYTYTIEGTEYDAEVDASDKLGQMVNLITIDDEVLAITTKFNGVLANGTYGSMKTNVAGKLDGYKTETEVVTHVVADGAIGEAVADPSVNKYDAYQLIDLDQNGKVDMILVFPVEVDKVSNINADGVVTTAGALTLDPETSTIPEELKKGDWILATTNGKGGYTAVKANTVTGTITSVRNESEVRIDGTWYKVIANAGADNALSASNLGDKKTLVLVGNNYATHEVYTEPDDEPEVTKDLAIILALGEANQLTGNQQANLLLADGSVATAVYVKAATGTELTAKTKLYTFKAENGVYTLTNATTENTGYKKGEADKSASSGAGYVANASATAATIGGKFINDDAVIVYAYKSTEGAASDITATNKKGVTTGADIKEWGTDFGTANFYFYETVDGIDYVQFAVLVDTTASNSLPNGRDAQGTESYGFVVSTVAREYDAAEKAYYAVYTIWNGANNVEVKEKLASKDAVIAAAQGVAIEYEDLGDGKVTAVVAITNRVAITGFSVANGVLKAEGESDMTLTSNTKIFNINTTPTKIAGVNGDALKAANADKDANAYIKVVDGKVVAIFVETVNGKLPAAPDPNPGTEPGTEPGDGDDDGDDEPELSVTIAAGEPNEGKITLTATVTYGEDTVTATSYSWATSDENATFDASQTATQEVDVVASGSDAVTYTVTVKYTPDGGEEITKTATHTVQPAEDDNT